MTSGPTEYALAVLALSFLLSILSRRVFRLRSSFPAADLARLFALFARKFPTLVSAQSRHPGRASLVNS